MYIIYIYGGSMEVSQNGWFVIDNPIKLDDLEVPPFQETPNYIYIYFNIYISCKIPP
jgi:hypothetical protein